MKFLLALLMVIVGALSSAKAQTAFDPTGLWLTENKRSVIDVKKCGDSLCGYISWIIEGGMQFDNKNPQENLRGQPMCGLQIVQGLKQNKNNLNEWQNGKIYKADDGDVYDATLTIKSQDRLKVRGYVGVPLFGKSQNWTRVSAADYPVCKAP